MTELDEAVLRLRNDPAFKVLLGWIEEQEKASLDVLVSGVEDARMRAAQGEVRFVRRLKELFSSAEKRASR